MSICVCMLVILVYYVFNLFDTGLTVPAPKVNGRREVNMADCPTTQEQWDRLVNKSLSASEFDLLVHSNSLPSLDTLDKLEKDEEDDDGKDLKSPTTV